MSKTALVVDDSATMREMVSYTLKQAGFEPLAGANGQEALDQLTGQQVDLIITDLNMPVMNGMAMIRGLRALPTYVGVPIVFLTTESDEAVKSEAKAAGATGWLTKPFKPDQLLSVVAKLVRK